ncbi:MAG TPA: hypothetical protein VH813_00410 [Candidatus Limnocylindrales bacterium]|jgi:hypothetical protein
MATTDARPGFRLPWNSDQRPQNEDETTTDEMAAAADGWATGESLETAETETSESDSVVADGTTWSEPVPTVEATSDPAPADPAPVAPAPAAAKVARARPSKFLAELTKAMQAAAETAREESLGRFQAEAKTHVEEIHGRSADDAAALRRNADEDVAAIREWSKAEIARIREETENRISGRKQDLERELDAHAARIERRIERVQGAVAAFESEMADFFERLLAEEDPTRFASMAEHLPEPTPFAVDDDDAPVALSAVPVAEVAVPEVAVPVMDEADDVAEVEAVVDTLDVGPVAEDAVEADAAVATLETDAAVETVETDAAVEADAAVETAETVETDAVVETVDVEPVAETVNLEPVAQTVDDAEPAVESDVAEATVETDATTETDASGAEVDPTADGDRDAEGEIDPRLAALALSGDLPEGDAFAVADGSDELEEIPVIGDDALAARLADLVATEPEADPTETTTTRVVVTGLVSVASIASFKRHLGRLEAVQAVGVTSGPEGEFVFTVTHRRDFAIRDSVPTLPGFQARVTGAEDGVVHVSAHDPETEG